MKTPVRLTLLFAVLAAVAGFFVLRGGAPEPLPAVTVYKSPTCGCCSKWVTHLQEAGFEVKTVDMPDVSPVKQRMGVPMNLASCHTAVVGGYVVEGHVPADVVKQLLAERPDAIGLTVPGMPIGSPGMEQGDRKEAYDVLLLKRGAEPTVYARR